MVIMLHYPIVGTWFNSGPGLGHGSSAPPNLLGLACEREELYSTVTRRLEHERSVYVKCKHDGGGNVKKFQMPKHPPRLIVVHVWYDTVGTHGPGLATLCHLDSPRSPERSC